MFITVLRQSCSGFSNVQRKKRERIPCGVVSTWTNKFFWGFLTIHISPKRGAKNFGSSISFLLTRVTSENTSLLLLLTQFPKTELSTEREPNINQSPSGKKKRTNHSLVVRYSTTKKHLLQLLHLLSDSKVTNLRPKRKRKMCSVQKQCSERRHP